MPLSVAGEQQFGNMVRQMGKMMDQLQKGYFNYCPAETWTPAVNLYENEIGYIVCVDLSGVEKEKIDLVVADGQLKLRGQRAVPFFFQAEDGIRDLYVTGVQTCALPI